jgi:hypothetical protein
MTLIEIFDSKLNNVWQKHGKFELTKFEYFDIPYIIQIEKKNLLIPGLEKQLCAEVSFHREGLEDDKAFSTTNEVKEIPVKVYGVVANGLQDKFTEYDVFYFSAERKHSANNKEFTSKKSIYKFIAERISKRANTFYYERENTYSKDFLISTMKLTSDQEESSKFKNPLKEVLKKIDFGRVQRI